MRAKGMTAMSGSLLLAASAVCIVSGILGATIGSESKVQNRSNIGFLLGFFFGPLGVLIMAILLIGDRR
jgi:hypothetical protein